jgi:hypothetical protein
MMLVRGATALPELQTKPLIPFSHLERVKKDILDSFVQFVGFAAAWEYDASVDFTKRLANKANLPAVIFRWTILDDGEHLRAMPRALSWSTISTTLYFDPKLSGTTTATQTGYLVDATAQFDDFLRKVRPGDVAVKVRAVSGGVEALAQTTVLEVDVMNKRLRVADDLFPAGTMYEIHWPYDTSLLYNTSRRARLTLDIYADPQASYGSGKTLEEIERRARAWWQTHLAQIVLQLNDTTVFDEYRALDLSGLLGETAQSFVKRARGEVGLLIGELVDIPWPSVESIRHTGRVVHDGDSVIHEKVMETTEDDARIVSET